ncbi:MAG: DUF3047 domain-containing protein [Methylococcales bacterium]|nr:DUF3047 domain-containing protein [Methylococcales bacterium]
MEKRLSMGYKVSIFLLSLSLFSIQTALAKDAKQVLGDFSNGNLSGWEEKSFQGKTRYQLQTKEGITVLKADSNNSASGLFKEQTINLDETPVLNWSWRIENKLQGLNEHEKSGDDYAARIYVLVKGGLAFWNAKAINYVWASQAAKNTVWKNAFANEQVMMIALKDNKDAVNHWVHEKRNVRTDFKKIIGADVHTIDVIAIMSDTDNGHGRVVAHYGDIWFSKD